MLLKRKSYLGIEPGSPSLVSWLGLLTAFCQYARHVLIEWSQVVKEFAQCDAIVQNASAVPGADHASMIVDMDNVLAISPPVCPGSASRRRSLLTKTIKV